MVKLHCIMVTKNEADRYLQSSLEWNTKIYDDLFVYDDDSTDDTVKICLRYTPNVFSKPNNVSSFIKHEARFREVAYKKFIKECEPKKGDWVLSLDADEYLVNLGVNNLNLRESIDTAINVAEAGKKTSINIHIPEAWQLVPYLGLRHDGLWGNIKNPTRLFKYISDEYKFLNKPMGCGSGPKYTWDKPSSMVSTFKILHVGYAEEEDRKEKYDRYTSLTNHGHNDKHIKSIISQPTIKTFPGQNPKIWKGVR